MSAALCGTTFPTIAPSKFSDSVSSTPKKPRLIEPALTKSVSTFRTIFTGIARPIPMLAPVCEIIAVLIPTKRPLVSSKAPPEFPWLMDASV